MEMKGREREALLSTYYLKAPVAANLLLSEVKGREQERECYSIKIVFINGIQTYSKNVLSLFPPNNKLAYR